MATEAYVLDASALLCLLVGEPGASRVEAVLFRSQVSAVNYAEVVSRLVDKGEYDDEMRSDLTDLVLSVVAVDRDLAELAGLLRADTRTAGLSLGDRCCLALAKRTSAVALTADRVWATLSVGVRVELLR